MIDRHEDPELAGFLKCLALRQANILYESAVSGLLLGMTSTSLHHVTWWAQTIAACGIDISGSILGISFDRSLYMSLL